MYKYTERKKDFMRDLDLTERPKKKTAKYSASLMNDSERKDLKDICESLIYYMSDCSESYVYHTHKSKYALSYFGDKIGRTTFSFTWTYYGCTAEFVTEETHRLLLRIPGQGTINGNEADEWWTEAYVITEGDPLGLRAAKEREKAELEDSALAFLKKNEEKILDRYEKSYLEFISTGKREKCFRDPGIVYDSEGMMEKLAD